MEGSRQLRRAKLALTPENHVEKGKDHFEEEDVEDHAEKTAQIQVRQYGRSLEHRGAMTISRLKVTEEMPCQYLLGV